MDWENKEPGEIIGASHLVHEYIGGDLSKLRIQFVNPFEFFGYDPMMKIHLLFVQEWVCLMKK